MKSYGKLWMSEPLSPWLSVALGATDQAILQRAPVHHSSITNKGQYSSKDPRPQNNGGWSELTETYQPKTFDLICVGENPVNKVEEGAPAKGYSEIKFHCVRNI